MPFSTFLLGHCVILSSTRIITIIITSSGFSNLGSMDVPTTLSFSYIVSAFLWLVCFGSVDYIAKNDHNDKAGVVEG
jgi:hypothetical protein